MTSTEWHFVPEDRQLFGRTIGEALARIVRTRWPRNTAKQVSQAWDLDLSTADNLIKGHASERTITKALAAERWPLIMALGEALTGEPYDAFLQAVVEETDRARDQAARRRERIRSLEARAADLVRLGAGVADE